MNNETADLFFQRGWRYFRYDEETAYLVDAEAEYLASVPDTMLTTCWLSSYPTADTTLRQFVNTWAAEPGAPSTDEYEWVHELQLALLGGRILGRFAHRQCRDDVEHYFSSSIDEVRSSPDVIVECDWMRASRYLFRARPEKLTGTPLDGVRVWTRGEHAPRAWTSFQPPLPPLAVVPFRDRFLALHAAVLRGHDGYGTAFVGDRNSGKTSCALDVGRRFGFELLGDETTFIHLRTTMAEPFPQALGIWTENQGKSIVPASSLFSRVARSPTEIRQIVILEPQTSGSSHGEELSSAMAMRALLPHYRDASASLDEVIFTLDHLVRNASTVRLRYSNRADLRELLDQVLHQ